MTMIERRRVGMSVFLLCLTPSIPAQAAAATEVTVIATIHGLHKTSPHYSYQALFTLLKKINPDYVGVEIRPEDMGRDNPYLADNYPYEMIEAARQWGPHAFGFDWLGDDVAGAPISPDWWDKKSPIKKLEHAMNSDPAFSTASLDAQQAAEMEIVKSATAASLNDGRYDRLNDDYYRQFRALVRGTKYQMLADFYDSRDRHIDAAIADAIRIHSGKRIVILTGADHRSTLMRYLRENFGSNVKLMPVP